MSAWPEKNRKCILNVSERSVNKFRHIVYYNDLSFVNMDLIFPSNVTFDERKEKNIVGSRTWVWTFIGKSGGVQFLDWPIEFGVWSMGLLNVYVSSKIPIEIIQIGGNCLNLTFGQLSTDQTIGGALKQLTMALMQLNSNKYGPSSWCYKKRIYISSNILYTLCLHINCPLEFIEYKCCSFFYKSMKQHRVVSCRGREFTYDMLWWVGPMIIAFVLFSISPLPILYLAWCLSYLMKVPDRNRQRRLERLPECSRDAEEDEPDFVFLDDEAPVTFTGTLFSPCIAVSKHRIGACSRILRSILPLLSLSVIGLQILLDYAYLNDFIIESAKKGVPLGFRSMLAGYDLSRRKFLPLLGGPFVACSLYVSLTILFVVIPKSLAQTLLAGLKDGDLGFGVSPLSLNFATLEKLGSVSIRSRKLYHKLYSVYLAQFYLLLNLKFWTFLIRHQLQRWRNWDLSFAPKCLLMFPYLLACLLEIIACVFLYGMPIVSFMLTTIRGYRRKLYDSLHGNKMKKAFVHVFGLLMVLAVIFLVFMLCTIFLDAFLFFARVVTFTYTGIVVYPKVSYGYLIFTLTVVYYLWDCVQCYSQQYQRLLKMTVKACEQIQSPDDPLIIINECDFKGVRKDVFEHVIERHLPRRKQMFNSLLKVFAILAILWISLSLLTKRDSFRELHVIMHVGTALCICALPKVFKSMCSSVDDRILLRKQRKDIVRTVTDYLCNDAAESERETDSETND